jgi:O-methyltransferase
MMKKMLKERLLRYAFSKIYSGEEVARYVRDDLFSQAMFGKGVFQYRTRPETFGPLITSNYDPVRATVLAVAMERLRDTKVPGSIAEVGVWRGDTSLILRAGAPERKLFLFDSFEGFSEDRETDTRFRDTSVEFVMNKLGNSPMVTPVKGFVPGTFGPYAGEIFALVVLDLDKYEATRDSLAFFHPRLAPGGYILFHDYNSPESNWGVKRAVDEYMQDKPDAMLDIPDRWGSLALCKGRPKTED